MMVIDAHAHLYPDAIAGKASGSIASFYAMPTRYDGSARALLDACARAGVGKCVLCAVATAPAQVCSINKFLAGEKERLGFAALCALHPHMTGAQLAEALDYARANGFAGAKLHPDCQRFRADDPKVFFLYEALAARGLPLLLHAGDSRYDFSSPARVANVARAFPGLTLVAAHLGGWSQWEDGARLLPGLDNVLVDTSSSLYSLPPARAREIIRAFGAQRVLFGTDFPMWDAAEELRLLRALELTPEEMEGILWGNAAGVFFRGEPRYW
ncbi:MAG: amidohydrolase family protein [Oscillospiraceae bacterium]|jgi:predicted TIM-barrel fold metal-dependent hydrolase|nr:amidohydrolase family protein [Oscillospiraceae bacterium]